MHPRLHDLTPFEPRLAVGPAPRTLEDVRRLAEHGITGLVSLRSDEDLRAYGLQWPVLWQLLVSHGIHPARVPIRDFDATDLRRHLDAGLAALDSHFQEGRRVYLHCTAGLNRSPTLALAHLTRSLGPVAALSALEACLPHALPEVALVTRWWKARRPA
jgi:protein-tyrosine phosphatase